MKTILITATVLAISFVSGFAQSSREVLIKHYNSGKAAYESKDYQQFLVHFQKVDSLSPNHPTITYNLAAAYALNNQPAKSFTYLQKVVLMNVDLLPAEDTDFDILKEGEDYKTLEYLAKELKAEVNQSKVAFTLKEKDLHPESIAFDPKSGRFFISSVHKNKIVSYHPKTGKYSDWKLAGADSLWAVMGMKVNAATNELWVCTTATKEMLNYDSTLEGKTAVLQFNLTSKKQIQRYEISGGHWFGDLVIHPSGEVYISDSRQPIIYKIDQKKNELAVFKDFSGALYNLQGVDFDEKGETLFIADYKTGLYAYEIKTEKLTAIQHPVTMTTKGIDGLYYYDNNLIGIHNGVRPMRVCRYKLDETSRNIIDYEYIDKAGELLDEPTLGVIVSHDFYYIANSPWGKYDKEGNLQQGKLTDPIILNYLLK